MGRDDLRVISCHLGGSSSLTAIRGLESVATSMGTSPQSGILQNNRVGDLDPFTLPRIMERTGQSLEEVLGQLATEGGLLGISGASGDIRDLEEAAAAGDSRASLALETFVSNIRQYLGWMLVELGGADAIVFTGGIGENSATIRQAVCHDLKDLGIGIDAARNDEAQGESLISGLIGGAESPLQIWVVPTHEELIVARQTYEAVEE